MGFFDNFERAFKAMMVVSIIGAASTIGVVIYVAVAVVKYLGSH